MQISVHWKDFTDNDLKELMDLEILSFQSKLIRSYEKLIIKIVIIERNRIFNTTQIHTCAYTPSLICHSQVGVTK